MKFLLVSLVIWTLIYLSWRYERGFIRFQKRVHGIWMKHFVGDIDGYFKRQLKIARVGWGLVGLFFFGAGLEQIFK